MHQYFNIITLNWHHCPVVGKLTADIVWKNMLTDNHCVEVNPQQVKWILMLIIRRKLSPHNIWNTNIKWAILVALLVKTCSHEIRSEENRFMNLTRIWMFWVIFVVRRSRLLVPVFYDRAFSDSLIVCWSGRSPVRQHNSQLPPLQR